VRHPATTTGLTAAELPIAGAGRRNLEVSPLTAAAKPSGLTVNTYGIHARAASNTPDLSARILFRSIVVLRRRLTRSNQILYAALSLCAERAWV
jgi:hypothetical protein